MAVINKKRVGGARKRSPNPTFKPVQDSSVRLAKLAEELETETRLFLQDAARRHGVPLCYAVAALEKKFNALEFAQRSPEERTKSMHQHFEALLFSFQVLGRRLQELADKEFNTHAKYERQRKALLREGLEQALSERMLYVCHGGQELDLVQVLWPPMKKWIGTRIGLQLQVDDSTFMAWLRELLSPRIAHL